MSLKALLEAGDVQRLHTQPPPEPYTVAQHTWRMLVLLYGLWPRDAREPSHTLIWRILTHDCAELFTGDTPATAKWMDRPLTVALGQLEMCVNQALDIDIELNEEDECWLHGLDLLELYLYCEQLVEQKGQLGYQPIVEACLKGLRNPARNTPIAILAYMEKHRTSRTTTQEILGWTP